jgi:hypothetical protein
MKIERGSGREEGTATSRIPGRATLHGLRVIAGAMLAVGALMAGCSANGITGPAETDAGPSSVSGPRQTLGVGVITNLVPLKTEVDPEVEKANPDFSTSTETVFPVTEAVSNTCVQPVETPVLNGWLKVREKIAMDDLTMKYKMQTWKDTRGVIATATTYYDDDHDAKTAPRKMVIRYRNRQNTLDKFEVGPAGLPFSSEQEDVMLLERLSPEHGMKYGPYDDREDDDDDREYRHGPGDDLFVYAKQKVVIDNNGVAREQTVFRTECR